MKKGLVICLLITFLISGCNSNKKKENYDITKIEVFYIPFSISSPVQSDEEPLRQIPSFMITDSKIIQGIKNEIGKLKKLGIGNAINRNNLYLACDFYEKEKKVSTLLFDKNIINIDGDNYNNNQELIELLIKNYDNNSN